MLSAIIDVTNNQIHNKSLHSANDYTVDVFDCAYSKDAIDVLYTSASYIKELTLGWIV